MVCRVAPSLAVLNTNNIAAARRANTALAEFSIHPRACMVDHEQSITLRETNARDKGRQRIFVIELQWRHLRIEHIDLKFKGDIEDGPD